MIVQPKKGTCNFNNYFYKVVGNRIDMLNHEFFHNVELTVQENKVLVWLCGWDEWTIDTIISVFKKVRNCQMKEEGTRVPHRACMSICNEDDWAIGYKLVRIAYG